MLENTEEANKMDNTEKLATRTQTKQKHNTICSVHASKHKQRK